ncbi:MAG: PhoU domain-containing protein, partial [Caldisericota bacterium]|nr:PhoU domain-containing protein [Caldisericota bacterium]
NEDLVNTLQREITSYLTKITEHELSEEQGSRVMALMHSVNDIERVGDHATNLVELISIKDDKRLTFSEDAMDDVRKEFDHVIATYEGALIALRDYDTEAARNVKTMEKQSDRLTREFMSKNIARLNNHEMAAQSGVIVVDLLTNLERISDHSENIAEVVLGIY